MDFFVQRRPMGPIAKRMLGKPVLTRIAFGIAARDEDEGGQHDTSPKKPPRHAAAFEEQSVSQPDTVGGNALQTAPLTEPADSPTLAPIRSKESALCGVSTELPCCAAGPNSFSKTVSLSAISTSAAGRSGLRFPRTFSFVHPAVRQQREPTSAPSPTSFRLRGQAEVTRQPPKAERRQEKAPRRPASPR